MTNMAVLVASSSSALDDSYLPREDYHPHWMLEDLQLTVTHDKKFRAAGQEEEDEEASGGLSSAETRYGVQLSSVDLSIASSELIFGAVLLHEYLAVFAPQQAPDEAAEAEAAPAAEVVPPQTTPAGTAAIVTSDPSFASYPTNPTSAKLVMHFTMECSGGLHAAIIDDVGVGVLPLFELGIDHLSLNGVFITERESGNLEDANVQASLELAASFFNASNGYWEPAIEPWRVSFCMNRNTVIDDNEDNDGHGGGGEVMEEEDEGGGGGGWYSSNEGGGGTDDKPKRMVPETTVMITSHECFEVNLTPVLLQSVHSALLTFDKLVMQ